jgi:2-hydroxy-3-keto-5-methylthiopentenyl-1-phosphate phosphatase
VLAREGIELELRANRVDPRADGWRVLWQYADTCEACGELCKRPVLPANGEVVYVGDGFSDRCAALAADRVFARAGLARYLDEQGVPYEEFTDFRQLARALA